MIPCDRNYKPAMIYNLFAMIRQDACGAIATIVLIDPIEVNEVYRQFRLGGVGFPLQYLLIS